MKLTYWFGCYADDCYWNGDADTDESANRAAERHVKETGHGTWITGRPTWDA